MLTPKRTGVLKMEEPLAHQQLCKQENNFCLDQMKAEPLQIKEEQEEFELSLLKEQQEEFEPSQVKKEEEEEEAHVSRDKDNILLKWNTYSFEVSPVNEEKYHLEPEPDGDQLDPQEAAGAENQDGEGNHQEDTGLRSDKELEQNVFSSGEDHPSSFRRQTSKHGCNETQGDSLRIRIPPAESDDSCLSDSDDSDEDSRFKPGYESSSDEDSDSTSTASASFHSGSSKTRSWRRLAWETVQPLNSAKDVPIWGGSLHGADETREPIQYFRDFFDANLLNTIVQQSNLYFTQEIKNNLYSGLKLDLNELEQFIGTLVYMSVVNLPASKMYWASECRVEQVADVMSRERWKKIKEFIHFNDNSRTAAGSGDVLYKIRPVIDSLLQKFHSLPQDQKLSVAQHILPFKGTSGLLQYTPKRSRKWGYKIFVLCDTKGLVHSFHVFTGRIDPVPGEPDIGASGNTALKLTQVVHHSVNHLLCFDSWFSSLDLFLNLANKGIQTLGSVEESSLQGCSFSSDLELKKKGMGSFEEKRAAVDNLEIRAVKWFDYRGVVVASSFASAQPVSNIQKWDRKLKQKVVVECPSIISLYNEFTAGVDALNTLIASHRIRIRSRKYYLRLFFHFVDMVIVNSWLLYQRDCKSLDVPRKKQKDFLAFRISIAQALCMQGKDLSSKKRGWPFLDVESEFERKKRRGPAKAIPAQKVRSDAVGHWPMVESARQRCKLPNCRGQTVFKCSKCNVHLCLKKNKNCFGDFHK
ncbi:PREDICTED: piggyBac transposable element-derived protein 2-like [Cyprinodon variegatus]|uniref:piggyBac transposable element-derived protein 2-like n=1 Tax=Cyprinodon variegatus TaxID=28743 RepID=UPI000742A3C7|nr:PREDICTED: piggyBac transposable element-derived protein 2-like [Cyprinodon variegatus]